MIVLPEDAAERARAACIGRRDEEKIPITVGELLADEVPKTEKKIEDLEDQVDGLQQDLDEANNEIRRLKHRLGLPTP